MEMLLAYFWPALFFEKQSERSEGPYWKDVDGVSSTPCYLPAHYCWCSHLAWGQRWQKWAQVKMEK